VYARRGRELMGCKSPVHESRRHRKMVMKALAEGKGETVRFGLKEAGVQSYEPTNRNSIQGQVSGQVGTTSRSPGFRGYGKCCGCVVKVYVFIRGDLIGLQCFAAVRRPVRRWLNKPWRMGVCCLSMRANINSRTAGKVRRVLQQCRT